MRVVIALTTGPAGAALLVKALTISIITVPGGDDGTCGSIFRPQGGDCEVLVALAAFVGYVVLTQNLLNGHGGR